METSTHIKWSHTSLDCNQASNLWLVTILTSKMPIVIIVLGPVFRVSPNELSFASVPSWKAIYGQNTEGNQPIKSEFYDMYGSGFESLCIGSERNPSKHRRMRASLSAAFSTKALLEQESVVRSRIDSFVERVATDGGPNSSGINMTKWYEMVAFDVLGEMAFGQSFGCIERGKPHYWQEMILDHLYFITVADNIRRFPFVTKLARLLAPFLSAIRDKHSQFTREKVSDRIKSSSSRPDFMSKLVSKVKNGEIEREEMNAHASTLIIAGGETVATFLAATTFYLVRDSIAYSRGQNEIRSRFATYESIEATAAQQLPFLQAVINEGLRIYPPGSQGFPRLSPGASIDGHWVPPGVRLHHLARGLD